jgi:hypothetical protein
MEMVARRLSNGSEMEVSHHDLSIQSDMADDEDEMSLEEQRVRSVSSEKSPNRLFRHPDLVELPNLRSKTKVAVPVSLSASSHSKEEVKLSHGAY